jgi:hypothetical protein
MRAIRCLVAFTALAAAAAAEAQTPPRPGPPYEPNPQERALDQAERVLRQLQDILRAIPTFDPPVVTPEGDILIRRRPPRPRPGEPDYSPPGPEESPQKL